MACVPSPPPSLQESFLEACELTKTLLGVFLSSRQRRDREKAVLRTQAVPWDADSLFLCPCQRVPSPPAQPLQVGGCSSRGHLKATCEHVGLDASTCWRGWQELLAADALSALLTCLEHLLHGEGIRILPVIFTAYSVNHYEQQQQHLSQMDHLKLLANLKIVKEVAAAKAFMEDGVGSSISCLQAVPAGTESHAAPDLLRETYPFHSFPLGWGLCF